MLIAVRGRFEAITEGTVGEPERGLGAGGRGLATDARLSAIPTLAPNETPQRVEIPHRATPADSSTPGCSLAVSSRSESGGERPPRFYLRQKVGYKCIIEIWYFDGVIPIADRCRSSGHRPCFPNVRSGRGTRAAADRCG